jgi:hypothetical protein
LEVNGRVRPDDVRDDFWARFPQLTSQHIDRLYDELIPDRVRAPGNRPNRGVKAAFERAAGPRARWSKAQKK